MTWVAAAIGGSALLGYLSSSNQTDAARSAASTSADSSALAIAAQDRAIAEQTRQYDLTRGDLQPWRTAGTNALAQMGTYPAGPQGFSYKPFSYTAADFAKGEDPGYAFRLSEGLKTFGRSADARGGLLSGATLKGATRYNQNMASQEYANAYGRGLNEYNTNQANALTGYNSQVNANNTGYNRLAGMAGIGQTANTQLAQAGQNLATGAQNTASNTGNIIMTNAANQGNSAMAAANARSSAYGGTANMLGYGLNYLNSGGGGGGYNSGDYMSYLNSQASTSPYSVGG